MYISLDHPIHFLITGTIVTYNKRHVHCCVVVPILGSVFHDRGTPCNKTDITSIWLLVINCFGRSNRYLCGITTYTTPTIKRPKREVPCAHSVIALSLRFFYLSSLRNISKCYSVHNCTVLKQIHLSFRENYLSIYLSV